MASRRQPESIAPSLTPQKSIELLQQHLDDCERIKALQRGDLEIQKWADTTEEILHRAFGRPDGEPHRMTRKFTNAGSFPIRMVGRSGRGGTSQHELQQQHYQRTSERQAVLESCIEQLGIFARSAVTTEPGEHQMNGSTWYGTMLVCLKAIRLRSMR